MLQLTRGINSEIFKFLISSSEAFLLPYPDGNIDRLLIYSFIIKTIENASFWEVRSFRLALLSGFRTRNIQIKIYIIYQVFLPCGHIISFEDTVHADQLKLHLKQRPILEELHGCTPHIHHQPPKFSEIISRFCPCWGYDCRALAPPLPLDEQRWCITLGQDPILPVNAGCVIQEIVKFHRQLLKKIWRSWAREVDLHCQLKYFTWTDLWPFPMKLFRSFLREKPRKLNNISGSH